MPDMHQDCSRGLPFALASRRQSVHFDVGPGKGGMGKKRKRPPKIHHDEEGEFRWETFFVRGKEKRRKIRMLDGKDFDYEEYIRANADDIWLKQHDEYEILHERQMERNRIEQGSEPEADNKDPF